MVFLMTATLTKVKTKASIKSVATLATQTLLRFLVLEDTAKTSSSSKSERCAGLYLGSLDQQDLLHSGKSQKVIRSGQEGILEA